MNDVAVVEGSSSVVSAASDGSVHCWRVDTASSSFSTVTTPGSGIAGTHVVPPRVSDISLLRTIDPCEGEVLSVTHFETRSASLIAFSTQEKVRTWDLRTACEPFSLSMGPEFGHLTSMAVGDDSNWMVTGTGRGFVGLWDVRFHKLVKILRHNTYQPIMRLGAALGPLPWNDCNDSRPYIVVGCGTNETAVFDAISGSCNRCLRVLQPEWEHLSQSTLPQSCYSLPTLQNISIPSEWTRRTFGMNSAITRMVLDRASVPEPRILSFVGKLGGSGNNHLITGGGDGFIRYWDLASPLKCYTMSGLCSSQPKPIYESVSLPNRSAKLFLCRQMSKPTIEETVSSKIPQMMERGAISAQQHHRDAILDLKKIDYPTKGLLSCSRDGTIKFWK